MTSSFKFFSISSSSSFLFIGPAGYLCWKEGFASSVSSIRRSVALISPSCPSDMELHVSSRLSSFSFCTFRTVFRLSYSLSKLFHHLCLVSLGSCNGLLWLCLGTSMDHLYSCLYVWLACRRWCGVLFWGWAVCPPHSPFLDDQRLLWSTSDDRWRIGW